MSARLLSVLASVAVAVTAGATAAGMGTAAGVATQLQENRAAARRDAREHLAELRLPRDVTRLRSVPRLARENGVATGSLRSRFGTGDVASWSTTADPDAIVAYLRAHVPAGAVFQFGGGMTDDTTLTRVLYVSFEWPQLGDSVYARTLNVSIVTPVQGSSAIVAQSSSSWIVPRPRTELVPSDVHVVALRLRFVTLRPGNALKIAHVRTFRYVFWRHARVASLVRSVNWMPALLPGSPGWAMSCTLHFQARYSSTLTLDFERGAHGPTVASVDVEVHPGRNGSSGRNSCDPVELRVGQRHAIALTSQTFVSWIGWLTGRRIS